MGHPSCGLQNIGSLHLLELTAKGAKNQQAIETFLFSAALGKPLGDDNVKRGIAFPKCDRLLVVS